MFYGVCAAVALVGAMLVAGSADVRRLDFQPVAPARREALLGFERDEAAMSKAALNTDS